MTFPQTRLTLIRRLVEGSSEQDWRMLLDDYWGPICRFSARTAMLSAEDAEDVASKTFELILESQLLAGWQTNRTAKLRTFLCAVVKNVLANQARVHAGRRRILEQHVQTHTGDGPLPVRASAEVSSEPSDAFYAAWVDELVKHSVETVRDELHESGKGDYYRTLYGKLCEEMTSPEISAALGIKVTDVENYYRAAKQRLAQALQQQVRAHVARYCDAEEVDDEFEREWAELGDYLHAHGGLERLVRASCLEPAPRGGRSDSFIATVKSFSRHIPPSKHAPSGNAAETPQS